MSLEAPIEIIRDTKDKIFKILDEIKNLSVGFNVLLDPKSIKRWEVIREHYYEILKQTILYELNYIKIDHDNTLQ